MSTESLVRNLVSTYSFQAVYRKALLSDVTEQLTSIQITLEEAPPSREEWSYLLKVANILMLSSYREEQDRFLRLAQSCLKSSTSPVYLKSYAVDLLQQAANFPAISLAKSRKIIPSVEVEGERSSAQILAEQRVINKNTIYSQAGEKFICNGFQQAVWDSYHDNFITSASAPTAAGKSWILYQLIAEQVFSNESFEVLYLVPTRALINQVSSDLSAIFDRLQADAEIITLPIPNSEIRSDRRVYVFTQERLNLLSNQVGFSKEFNLVLVDEAHKVGDSYRGILLQQAIQRVVGAETKVIYTSPFSSNPEIFSRAHAWQQSFSSVHSPISTVNQNIFWVTQMPSNSKRWKVDYLHEGPEEVGLFELAQTPSSQIKRLAFVAASLGSNYDGNLVYVNIPSEAERAAHLIKEYLGLNPVDDQDINDVIELCKKTVHKQFILADVLKYGVGFHYGNIPQIIRERVEKLFSDGKLKYLACTSTLVEGVNMSCKNIFLRGPKKGRQAPMSNEDFWNLAGRAGRWGKEFQGNIFCIDTANSSLWPFGPPTLRTEYQINPSVGVALSDYQGLMEFLDDDMASTSDLVSEERRYLVSYLIETKSKGDLGLSVVADYMDIDSLQLLDEKISSILNACQFPLELLLRNPGISPFSVGDLYSYFEGNLERIEELVPSDPASDDTLDSYVRVFQRINRHLSQNVFGNSGRTYMLARLVVLWMNGKPLSYLISDRERYQRERGTFRNISSTIREVFNDVENIARFVAPKFLGCYVDVLQSVAVKNNLGDRVRSLENVQLSLEFGVSMVTHFSLIRLGLSRTSAIALSEYMSDSELSVDECRSWLRSRDLSTLDLPALVLEEILGVIGVDAAYSY